MKKLHSLKAAEVSAVDLGAVRKKFLVLKNHTGDTQMTKTKLAEIAQGNAATLAKVETILKACQEEMKKEGGALSDDAQKAAKAAVRLLEPFKDELSSVMPQLMEACGMAEEAEPMVEKAKDVSDEQHAAAEAVAKQAYIETYKSVVTKPGSTVNPKKESEMEPVIKADGTLNLQAVPEASRPAIEAIYKSNQELVKKAATLETELKAERDARLDREFVAKAAEFKNLTTPKEELVKVMKALHGVSKEQYDAYLGTLKAADEQVAKSALFTEIGTTKGAAGADSWTQIEKAVEGIVAKSGGKQTKEQATAAFLETPEGAKLYAAHKAERNE